MKKIIKLNESDLINIVKKVLNESTSKGLPILPDGRLYNINDFISPITKNFPIRSLPKYFNNGEVNILRYGDGAGKIDDAIKNMNITQITEIISKGCYGSRTIIYPVTKEGSPAVVPPFKYVIQGLKNGEPQLNLVPICSADASVIASKTDVDYNKTLDSNGKPYLVK